MSRTQGRWIGDSGFPDGQIFVGATDFSALVAAGGVLTSSAAGLLTLNTPASTTANIFANISTLLRTGVLATPANSQEQFGTAAALPGPSAVVNTSDPLDFPPGFPPWTAAVMPTITGGNKGPIPKGLKVNWVDCIYEIDTGAITSVTFGLTNTQFPAVGTSGAPAVTNIIALAANGLPVAANTTGQVTRTRITVTTPIYNFLDGSELIANINFVTPSSNTVKFYGIILGVTYNYA